MRDQSNPAFAVPTPSETKVRTIEPDSDRASGSQRFLNSIRIAPPGFLLIMLSSLLVYILTISSLPTIVTFTVIGLAFLLAFAGIVLLFRSVISGVAAQGPSMAVGSSDVEEAVRQLGKNYDILRRQATQGFILAGAFMAMGILVILTGSLGDMFGFTKAASNLTTIAGVIVEVVSGLGLYLFKETFKQLNATSDQLYGMWKILAALKKSDDLPDDRRADVVVSLINKLVGIDAPTARAGTGFGEPAPAHAAAIETNRTSGL